MSNRNGRLMVPGQPNTALIHIPENIVGSVTFNGNTPEGPLAVVHGGETHLQKLAGAVLVGMTRNTCFDDSRFSDEQWQKFAGSYGRIAALLAKATLDECDRLSEPSRIV